MQKDILADRIVVYRNAIPHKAELIKVLKESTYWEKWYDVGKQIPIPSDEYNFNFQAFPTKSEWDQKVGSWAQSSFFQRYPEALDTFKWMDLENAFYETTADYLKMFPIEDMQNWYRGGTNVLRYDAKKEDEVTTEASGTLNYALPFHTDYHYPTAHLKGTKPALTVTMYLNDDYEGGDIEYRIFDKQYTHFRIEGTNMINLDTNETVPGFNYKPQSGDIIIFPSKLPFYHGVKKVTYGQKLFFRTFWMYSPITPDPECVELTALENRG
jgi:hypothetical protein